MLRFSSPRSSVGGDDRMLMRTHALIARYELDRSERSALWALKMRERVYGAEHPDICNHLALYATLQRMRGDFESAKMINERILRICELYSGKDSFLTATALYGIGMIVEGTYVVLAGVPGR